MAKNITIQEGGTPYDFTVSKIKTCLKDGGTGFQYWVPEDAMNLDTKTITENGVYMASDEDLLGYSKVVVNVEGGGGGGDDLVPLLSIPISNIHAKTHIDSTRCEDGMGFVIGHSESTTATFEGFEIRFNVEEESSYTIEFDMVFSGNFFPDSQNEVGYGVRKTSSNSYRGADNLVRDNEWHHYSINFETDEGQTEEYLFFVFSGLLDGYTQAFAISNLVLKKGAILLITENGKYYTANYVGVDVQVEGSGEGGGSSSVLVPKTITQNGTYDPANDNADGYSIIKVNVPSDGSVEPPKDFILDQNATLKTIWGVDGGGEVVNDWAMTFLPANIGSNSWVDSIDSVAMVLSGGYTLNVGESLSINGSHGCYIPVSRSEMFIAMRFKVDSAFTPKTDRNWYNMSCIVGCELSNQQKDYGAVINSDGFLCFGYQSTYTLQTEVYLLDGQEHDLKIALNADGYFYMECDGTYLGEMFGGSGGNNITQLGIMWNKAAYNTYVKGTVYEVKIAYTY